jgi:hypothetical protein
MQAKTALAVAGSVLAVPSAALAASDESSSTDRDALHPSGKLSHDEGLEDHLVRTNVRLARRLERKPNVRRLRTLPVSVLRERNSRLRKRVARHENAAATASAPLEAIAACESGGNPSAIGGGGMYRGKYQFSTSTWASVGGSGDPAAAPEAEQDRRAAMLYSRTGPSSWPVCGR